MHRRLILTALLAVYLTEAGCQSQQFHHPTSSTLLVKDGQSDTRRNAAPADVPLNNGKLERQTIDAVARQALAHLADLSQPWSEAWANWLEAARHFQCLSDTDWETYLKLGHDFRLDVREWISPRDPLPMRIVSTGYRGHFIGISRKATITVERGPAATVMIPVTEELLLSKYEIPLVTLAVPYRLLDDGAHTVSVELFVEFYDVRTSRHRWVGDATYKFTSNWILGSSRLFLPELVNNGPTRKQIEKSLTIEGIADPESREKSVWRINVKASNPPVALVCDIIGRANGKEWVLGELVAPPKLTTETRAEIFPAAWHLAEPVDIILRPNPQLEKQSVAIFSAIWNKPIVARLPPGKIGTATIQDVDDR